MIEPIQFAAEHYEIDDLTRKYVLRKVGRLDRYLPRHIRKSCHADVLLRQINAAHGNKYQAEVRLYIGDVMLQAADSTMNMLAAVDIVEATLAARLHDDKIVSDPAVKRGVLERLRRR